MKEKISILRVLLSALLIAVSLQFQFAIADPAAGNPALGAAESGSQLAAKIASVTDPMLRDAIAELLRNSLAYTPPKEGSGNIEDVLTMCRSSQRVYCNFLGMQATSTSKTVARNKYIIKDVYDVTLGRIQWISDKENNNSDLIHCLASIKDKYQKMGLDTLAGPATVVTLR